MLSFLREQGPESLRGKSPGAKTYCEKGKTQKPMSDTQYDTDQQGQEYLTVTAQDKNVRKTTSLLAVFFAIGLLCLWFMIKKSTPQEASAAPVSTEETQIEMAIARLTGVRSEMFNQMERIVKKFYEFSDVQQVQVKELAKNPFRVEKFLGNLKRTADMQGEDFDINADLMSQRQLREQAENMQLLAIMQSDQGKCCMIDDKILYEGDLIRGFKVRQIGDNFVKLQWDRGAAYEQAQMGTQLEGMEIILKLIIDE